MNFIEHSDHFSIGGKTFPHKESLKALGGRWNSENATWDFVKSDKMRIELEEFMKKSSKKSRKCGYCHKEGHTKPSCPILNGLVCDYCHHNKHLKNSCPNLLADLSVKNSKHKFYRNRDKIMNNNIPVYAPKGYLTYCYCNNSYLCAACEHGCCEDAEIFPRDSKLHINCKNHNINTNYTDKDSALSNILIYGEKFAGEIKSRNIDEKMINYVGD
jgi:hypothetical protein